MEQAVAREDGASVDAGPAVEIGEAPSGLFHEDLERGDVPRLHGGRERDLALALGYPEIGREVAEASLDLRLIGEAQEAIPVAALPQEVHGRVNHERALELIDRRHADELAITSRALTAERRVEHVHGRLIDDAGGDFAVLLERDQHGPRRNAANEVPRAIDRVYDEPPIASTRFAQLLAERSVIGTAGAQHADDRALRLVIGLGHRRSIGLQRYGESPAIVLECDGAAGARRLHHGLQA